MKAKHFIFMMAMTLLIIQESKARIVTATGSGNWESNSTWGGTAPACGDTINIPVGVTVTITSVLDYSGCVNPIVINVSGTLSFQNGKKLRLNCASVVVVNNGGWILSGGGGGNSNLIEICLVTVWNTAMGNLPGPVVLSNDPLPISLGYFNATAEKDHVLLQWTTFTEVNNQWFFLEKSTNGKDYKQFGRVAGAGTSSNLNEYTYTDAAPVNGIQYYRLLQQDFDGKITTFKPVVVKWEKESVLKIFPNPGKGEIFTTLPGSFKNQTARIQVQDMNHTKILQKDILLGENVSAVMLIAKTDNLRPGSYLLTILVNEQKFSRIIMVQ